MASQPDKVICKKCRLEFDGQALFCPNCGTARSRDQSGDPLVGTTIGDRYHLVERLGQGASGTIYRGEHVTLRRKVAVKVLHHELSRDDLAVERFRREATTVGEIDNDHIVEIHDFGRTDDGRLYLAMELLDGETLAEVLGREGRLPVDRAVDILIQLGEALMEAHAIGYVHRDLRPRNLFLARRRSRQNYLKLLDFGLAKLVEHEGEAASTSLGMTFGDPHYMSPEQAKGNPVDRRADIYSMGCIAFEMLTGAPPFTGEKVFDVLTRHVEEPPPDIAAERPDVPAWLAGAVMRCLAKRPDERFITVYRLLEALRQGSDSGHIMADEVARRRETDPPPSVSQAMAKLGRRDSTLEGDDLGRAETAADPRQVAPDPMPTPVPGSGQVEIIDDGPTEPSAAPELEDARDGEARAAGKPDRPAAPGISAAWYADGDAIGGHGELGEGDRARLAQARGQTPSNTGMLAAADDDEYYDEPRSRWPKIAAIAGGLAAALVLTAMLWPSGDGGAAADAPTDEPETVAEAEPEVAPEPAVVPAAAADAAVAEAAEDGETTGGDEAAATETDDGERAATETDAERERRAEAAAKRERQRQQQRQRQRERESDPDPADTTTADATDPAEDSTPAEDTTPEPDTTAASDEDAKKAEFYARLGQRALRNGDILGAATNFNKASELDAKNADAITGLGEIALGQGAYRAARNHFEKALRLRPKSSRLHTLLGETQLGAGNLQAAEKSFKQALILDPDNARAREGYNEAVGLVGP